ncbi:MAG: hypothetical protein KAQ68_10245 [Clostridiales bacterium]|nr:hypothetical protein [Clostridiales bacterium]
MTKAVAIFSVVVIIVVILIINFVPGIVDVFFSTYFPAKFFISLIYMLAINSLPILIYRHKIIKKKVDDEKTAIKISVFYGLIAFLICAILDYLYTGKIMVSFFVLLWIYNNYLILYGYPEGRQGRFTRKK